jgi:hypothetical protein
MENAKKNTPLFASFVLVAGTEAGGGQAQVASVVLVAVLHFVPQLPWYRYRDRSRSHSMDGTFRTD